MLHSYSGVRGEGVRGHGVRGQTWESDWCLLRVLCRLFRVAVFWGDEDALPSPSPPTI